MNTINNNHQLNKQGKLIHLLGLDGLTQSHLLDIIKIADTFISQGRLKQINTLQDISVANLFFEPSTRTRNTFELAASRCGTTIINVDLENSATKKNETLLDTMQTLEAMQIDLFVIRHKVNGMPHKIASHLRNASIINAGDGINAHPTQALLDILTIYQHKKEFSQCSIAIVGDILHSRVAHSDIAALSTLGVKDIRLIAPDALQQKQYQSNYIHCYSNMEQGLEGVDIIIVLRLQKERMLASDIPNESQYFQAFGLTKQRLSLAKSDVIVMHPGPINREVEIASDVADGHQSAILQQVTNGIAIRMAVMSLLISHSSNRTFN